MHLGGSLQCTSRLVDARHHIGILVRQAQAVASTAHAAAIEHGRRLRM